MEFYVEENIAEPMEFYVEENIAEPLALLDALMEALRTEVRRVYGFTDSEITYDQRSSVNIKLQGRYASGQADLVYSLNPSRAIDEKNNLVLCFLIHIGSELGWSESVAAEATKYQPSRSGWVESE